jgi:hypothetical protein
MPLIESCGGLSMAIDIGTVSHAAPLAQPKVLLVEDDGMIAIDLEDIGKRSFLPTLRSGCGVGEGCWLVPGLLVRA